MGQSHLEMGRGKVGWLEADGSLEQCHIPVGFLCRQRTGHPALLPQPEQCCKLLGQLILISYCKAVLSAGS